jgi:hypothetical protein
MAYCARDDTLADSAEHLPTRSHIGVVMEPVTIVALALVPSIGVLLLGCALATFRVLRDAVPRRRRLALDGPSNLTGGRGAR